MSTINVVTVTIGRNGAAEIGGTVFTLSALDWQEFQSAVSAALWQTSATNGEAWEEKHYGRTAWNGVEEESAKITLLNAESTQIVALNRRLETIRGMYAQDAIALSVGTSTLIERPINNR